MYKKRKLEINPSRETIGLLVSEKPQLNRVDVKTRKVNDTLNVYAKSNPKGKDVKEYKLSLRALTDYLLPKWEWTCKYYGLNFGGGHYGDDKYGTIMTTYVPHTTGTATQQPRVAIDDYTYLPSGWCDTIAWEAGSQGWFESVMLPATWRISGGDSLETTAIKCQMSLEGVIDNTRNVLPTHMRNTDFSMSSSAQSNIRADFPVSYNGGYQKHEFINNEPFRVYFEAYEVVPRDIQYDWFYSETKTNGRVFAKNIHTYVSSDYVRVRNNYSAGGSAAGGAGTYSSALAGTSSTDGQIICRKEDPGFAIRPWMSDTLKSFRVSAPIKGSIEPGGKFVYTMKCQPFVMLDSTYRRLMTHVEHDINPAGDLYYQPPSHCHLVPQFSKILVVRFWSDVGALGTATANGELESSNPHQYNHVSYMPGRLMHVVTEHHEARCMTGVTQGSRTFKDFTKLMYDQTAADQALWQGINDESDATQLIT